MTSAILVTPIGAGGTGGGACACARTPEERVLIEAAADGVPETLADDVGFMNSALPMIGGSVLRWYGSSGAKANDCAIGETEPLAAADALTKSSPAFNADLMACSVSCGTGWST